MTPAELQLWEKIQNFSIDDPTVSFKFSDRLARENDWKHNYAKRVVEEYKKYIFLCCVAESGVTPSDPVDQAWHLHLTFTRSYWTDLCKNTLGQEIHHNPTKGGDAEAKKFNGFYTSTHQLYFQKFGTHPPADIWQDNHDRFTDINFQRVNMGRYWLVKKPKFSLQTIIPALLLITCFLFIRASADFSIAVAVGVVTLFAVAYYVRNWGSDSTNKRNRDNDSSGCSGGDGGDTSWWHHGNSDSHTSHHGCHNGDSGCSSGCSGCSSSGCSGCSGGSH